MYRQTKLEEFVDGKSLMEPKPHKTKNREKSTLQRIEERLERIEEMLLSGQMSASITLTRPALTGGPMRSMVPIEKRRSPTAHAKELRELMGIEEDEIYLGTPAEILTALRNRD